MPLALAEILTRLRQRWLYILSFSVLFYLCYGWASLFPVNPDYRYPIGFAWELAIPFIPQTAWVYNSLSLLMVSAVIVIKQQDVRLLFIILSVQLVLACICFVMFPVSISFPDRYQEANLPWMFVLADKVNLENNYFPSLHVCFAVISSLVMMRELKVANGLIFLFWAFFIALSTILIHEHHVLDVAGGVLWALIGFGVYSMKVSFPPKLAPP